MWIQVEEKGAGVWLNVKEKIMANVRLFLNNANLYIVAVTGIMYDSTR